jgi:hypothetical protein
MATNHTPAENRKLFEKVVILNNEPSSEREGERRGKVHTVQQSERQGDEREKRHKQRGISRE